MENIKIIEMNGRKFIIKKFDARTGSYIAFKVVGLLGPIFKSMKVDPFKMKQPVNISSIIDGINFTDMVSSLTSLPEEDFRYIQDKCLQVCFESLPAGEAQVLTKEGNYGIVDIERDVSTIMALTVHSLVFNLTGFFSGSPLSSLIGV